MLAPFERPCDEVEEGLDAETVLEELDHLLDGESGLLASDGKFVDGGNKKWACHGPFPFREFSERVP